MDEEEEGLRRPPALARGEPGEDLGVHLGGVEVLVFAPPAMREILKAVPPLVEAESRHDVGVGGEERGFVAHRLQPFGERVDALVDPRCERSSAPCATG